MSNTYIPTELRRLAIERAGNRCEYCQQPASLSFLLPHELDHVIAEKHDGLTVAENLAYTCWRCNRHKGTDLGSFDPLTGLFSFLFNPRTQTWAEHFAFDNNAMAGLTAEGRTTIKLLHLTAKNVRLSDGVGRKALKEEFHERQKSTQNPTSPSHRNVRRQCQAGRLLLPQRVRL